MASEKQTNNALAKRGLEFTLDLYKQSIAGSNENVFISPLSISFALAMTYAGAKENTASEMKQVLKLTNFETNSSIHEAFQDVMDSLLGSQSSSIKLDVANRIYVHDEMKVLSDFIGILEKHYKSTSKNVNFVNEAEKIRLEVNKWVEDQTNAKIKDLIAPGVFSPLTRMVLVNAIYFKGDWLKKFNPKKTTKDQYFLGESKIITADLMHLTSEFRHGIDKNLNCQILELPYVNETLSMFIILPNEINGLQKLEESLTVSEFEKLTSNMFKRKVIVSLPKFKIETSLSLKEILTALGMNDAFNATQADFSGMTGARGLYISHVLHKTFLEVNEEGSEAAAATAVVMKLRSRAASCDPPFTFRADHPFLLFIRDNRSGCILFWGRIINPNSSSEVRETGIWNALKKKLRN